MAHQRRFMGEARFMARQRRFMGEARFMARQRRFIGRAATRPLHRPRIRAGG